MIVILLILLSLIIFFPIILSASNPNRLFNFFLVTIFICNIIPDTAGIRINDSLPLINAQKIFNAILLISLLLTPAKKGKGFDKSILFLLIIFISARFIAIFYASNLTISLLYWLNAVLTIYLYYFAAVRLIDSEQKMNKVIKVIFYTGTVVAFANYFEFITGINLAHLFPNVSNILEYWKYDRMGIVRIFGLKADPVVTAYYLTFTLPLGIYLFHLENKKKWLHLTILIILASFLNTTRTSIFALAVMLFIYTFIINKTWAIKIIFLFVFVLLFIAIDNPINQLFTNTLSLTNPNKIQGFDYTRIFGLLNFIPFMISKIPFWGIGTGSLIRADLMQTYYNDIGYLYNESSIRTELPFFITTLIDSGFVASLSFLFLVIVIIKKSFSFINESMKRENQIGSYLFIIFIGYFICMTSNGIFDSFNIIYLMMGILNFIINTEKNIIADK